LPTNNKLNPVGLAVVACAIPLPVKVALLFLPNEKPVTSILKPAVSLGVMVTPKFINTFKAFTDGDGYSKVSVELSMFARLAGAERNAISFPK